MLATSLDYETTLRSVARLAVPALADACVVDIREDDGTLRRLAVAHEAPQADEIARELLRRYPPDPNGPHPLARVLRTGQAELHAEVTEALLEAVAHDPRHREIIRQLGIRSALVAPLTARGHILGAISLVSTTPSRRFGPADLALAEDLARRAGLAVDNARLYREAQEATRARDRLLANLSHELRNPLNAILGWAQILGRLQVPEPLFGRALDAIERNTRMQAQLIEDLLDLSRMATGKFSVELQRVDLGSVVATAVDDTRLTANAKGVRVTAHLGAVTVLGDPGRLHQVVVNLVSNAIKFTDSGGWVDVHVVPLGRTAEVRVVDSGRGIEPELLPHVFEQFRQGTAGGPGLGLGLAIVRSIVELHGGTVRAESAGAGKGATFTVTVPVATT